MCGILAQVSPQGPIDPTLFQQKRDTLTHRGPDGAGTWMSDHKQVALGHRRLSFLDLSDTGQQPMTNEDGTLWLTFNGEIYNYLELREDLIRRGHQFASETDSEVIIHAYEEWGLKALERLNGMFAFALWQTSTQTLLLARDRYGIKPLYYGSLNGSLFAASELKAILHGESARPGVSDRAIGQYLAYRFIPSPGTIWEGLFKLPPAHYVLLQPFGKKEAAFPPPQSYWEIPSPQTSREKDIPERVDELLRQSVRRHLRSDVPIGAFLSGGYDSSALVAYMREAGTTPDTFTIGFTNWTESEDQYARLVADHLGCPLEKTIVGKEQLSLLDTLVYHYDEPIADISIIPTYLVSELASRNRKAVFSGEGADELFGGYWWQKKAATLSAWRYQLEKWTDRLSGRHPTFMVEQYAEAMSMGRFTEHNLPDLLHPDRLEALDEYADWFYAAHYRGDLAPLKAFQRLDVRSFMGELVLTKIDRASMAHSLEVRVPFLDNDLFNAVFPLPPGQFFRKDITKYLLHENLKKRLPQRILDRPKQGFVGPDTYYMDIPWYAEVLRDGKLVQDQIIQASAIERLVGEQKHWELWKLAVLEKWMQRWT